MAELQTIWAKIAPSSSWCALILPMQSSIQLLQAGALLAIQSAAERDASAACRQHIQINSLQPDEECMSRPQATHGRHWTVEANVQDCKGPAVWVAG